LALKVSTATGTVFSQARHCYCEKYLQNLHLIF